MRTREDFLHLRERLLTLREELRGEMELSLDAFAMSGFDSSLGRPVTGDYFLRHPCLIGWVCCPSIYHSFMQCLARCVR